MHGTYIRFVLEFLSLFPFLPFLPFSPVFLAFLVLAFSEAFSLAGITGVEIAKTDTSFLHPFS